MQALTELELSFLYALQSFHTPWLDELMKFITSLGDGGWFWIALGLVLACVKRTRVMGFSILISLLAGFLIGNLGLKLLIGRQRPCWIDPSVSLLIQSPPDFSFPSGHSLVSFEGAVSIYLHNKRWGVAAIGLAVLIAFSRLYLFVHFPTDVIAGSLLGILIAWVVYRLMMKRKIALAN